jgi:hypothetical protein
MNQARPLTSRKTATLPEWLSFNSDVILLMMPIPAVEIKLHRDGYGVCGDGLPGAGIGAGSMKSLAMSGRLLLLAVTSDGTRSPVAEPW